MDTDWVELTTNFYADSAYTNLVIGCFKNNNDIQLKSRVDGMPIRTSYYFIGSVSVEEPLPPIPPPVDTTKHVFPSAFTPNGDGNNDVFRVISNIIEQYTDYTLSVFNRWGELVFTTQKTKSGWDGMYKGMPAPVGAYFYLAEFKIKGAPKIVKGEVTLIR